MGIFNFINRAYVAGKAQYKLALSVAEVIEQIDCFRLSKDVKYLNKAAYIAYIGIIENPLYPTLHFMKNPLYVVVHQQRIKMTMFEAITQSLGKIYSISEELPEHDRYVIESILEGGDSFYSIERDTPQAYRDKFHLRK